MASHTLSATQMAQLRALLMESSSEALLSGLDEIAKQERLKDSGQKDSQYRIRTNPAGIPQYQRQDGRIAVLMGTETPYTSRFCAVRKWSRETDEKFQERMKKAEEKRLHMLFCPELVEITLDPTLSSEQRLDRFHKFIEENYPEDMDEDDDDMLQVVGYGETLGYRELRPEDTPSNVSKFCKVRNGIFTELKFDLRVVWMNPGTKFKIREDLEYGNEELITDEDFDVI